MIFVVEMPRDAPPRAWFAYDEEDLLHKLVEAGALHDWSSRRCAGLRELLEASLRARGECRMYWSESEATAAFERVADPAWQGDGWRARWALREQLVAIEVLADDL
ncbi:MAG TPA: hypothetical protein VJ743_00970 [Albitalea sp.]|nr:hypothetical protein [Albitalea sp.]